MLQMIEMTIGMLGKHLNDFFPIIFTALKCAQTIPALHKDVCRVGARLYEANHLHTTLLLLRGAKCLSNFGRSANHVALK